MTIRLLVPADRWSARAGRPAGRRRKVSLYSRVVAVNAAILLTAVLVLALTPVTVSFPLAAHQGILLGGGVAVMILVDAAILRLSFSGLTELVRRMETLDVLRPRERLREIGTGETRALIAGFNAMWERLEVERRASTRQTLSALESERRRISRELHDEIGQRLTGTLLQLGRLLEDAPDPLRARIAAIQSEERATLDEVGALAWQLRPGLLDDLGLLSALDALADSLNEHGEALIQSDLPPWLPPMPDEQELVIFRIAQEALTNAVRHSGANTIRVRLDVGEHALSLTVTDDGQGATGAELEGPGIRSMRERALLVGGDLLIDSSGQGVTVRLQVPATNIADQ